MCMNIKRFIPIIALVLLPILCLFISFTFSKIHDYILIDNEHVKIGTQVWQTQNLNVSTFRNGDIIQEAKTLEEWKVAAKNKQPAWCYYNNDEANGSKYGRLYNWYAANDPRGLAPEGWHIPSDKEWDGIINYFGSELVAMKLKQRLGWKENGNGTNESDLALLPGGYRNSAGLFVNEGYYGDWWTSTKYLEKFAFDRYAKSKNNNLGKDFNDFACGLSVRCVQD